MMRLQVSGPDLMGRSFRAFGLQAMNGSSKSIVRGRSAIVSSPAMLRKTPSRYGVLIVGGGPAGSTAAILLSKAGWSVALIEKASFPRPKVCGEFISAASFPLLFELGVGKQFVALAGPE